MEKQPTPAEARAALEDATRAYEDLAGEVGLPRPYWWVMAAGWICLGVLGDLAPWPVAAIATFAFGAAHAGLASRLLDGRQRTQAVRLSAAAAGRRTPWLVVAMLAVFVLVTIGAALVLDADGADHPAIWAGVFVAAIVGFGGDNLLGALLRWTRR